MSDFVDALRECLGLNPLSHEESTSKGTPQAIKFAPGTPFGEWIIGEYGNRHYKLSCRECGAVRRSPACDLSNGRTSKICKIHRGKQMEYVK